MTPIGTAAAALAQILSSATSTLNAAREQAQRSKDKELKALVNQLYDEMAELREAVRRVTEENESLRRQLSQQADTPEPKQVGATVFYYAGENGPYCQPCFDGKGKLVLLSPPQDWNHGIRRHCTLCEKYFYEKPMEHRQTNINPDGGPQGWMR